MGIQGLLPLLKSIQIHTNLSEFRGKTFAVDAYVWLHRGAYACATELVTGVKTTKYVDYVMHRVRMMKYHGITPYIVFDGGPLPAKKGTEQDRHQKREQNRAKADALAAEGKHSQARDLYVKCVDVTPQMAFQLIKALRAESIDYIVAPYEADAQLYFLEKVGIVDGLITEDSDLLVYGSSLVLFKLDSDGNCTSIPRSDFSRNTDAPMSGWTDIDFRAMAILSGCDYLASIPGLGLKTAHKLLRKYKTVDKVLTFLRLEGGNLKVPDGYLEEFRKAEKVFMFQRVYDPSRRMAVHLNEIPAGMEWNERLDEYVGRHLEPELAQSIAEGNTDPITHLPMNDINPGFKPRSLRNKDLNARVSGAAHNVANTAGGILNFFKPIVVDKDAPERTQSSAPKLDQTSAQTPVASTANSIPRYPVIPAVIRAVVGNQSGKTSLSAEALKSRATLSSSFFSNAGPPNKKRRVDSGDAMQLPTPPTTVSSLSSQPTIPPTPPYPPPKDASPGPYTPTRSLPTTPQNGEVVVQEEGYMSPLSMEEREGRSFSDKLDRIAQNDIRGAEGSSVSYNANRMNVLEEQSTFDDDGFEDLSDLSTPQKGGLDDVEAISSPPEQARQKPRRISFASFAYQGRLGLPTAPSSQERQLRVPPQGDLDELEYELELADVTSTMLPGIVGKDESRVSADPFLDTMPVSSPAQPRLPSKLRLQAFAYQHRSCTQGVSALTESQSSCLHEDDLESPSTDVLPLLDSQPDEDALMQSLQSLDSQSSDTSNEFLSQMRPETPCSVRRASIVFETPVASISGEVVLDTPATNMVHAIGVHDTPIATLQCKRWNPLEMQEREEDWDCDLRDIYSDLSSEIGGWEDGKRGSMSVERRRSRSRSRPQERRPLRDETNVFGSAPPVSSQFSLPAVQVDRERASMGSVVPKKRKSTALEDDSERKIRGSPTRHVTLTASERGGKTTARVVLKRRETRPLTSPTRSKLRPTSSHSSLRSPISKAQRLSSTARRRSSTTTTGGTSIEMELLTETRARLVVGHDIPPERRNKIVGALSRFKYR